MNTSNPVTTDEYVKKITTVQLEVLPSLNYRITSEEQFISTIIPLLEKMMPDYLCDGYRPYPMAVYYGKNTGEYLFALLDTWSSHGIYPSGWDDRSLVLMAVYFGCTNGEHVFYFGDGACILQTRARVAREELARLEHEESQ